MKASRRNFLSRCLLATGGVSFFPSVFSADDRKTVAFLGTEVRTHSHSQHFLDRLTMGYGWRGQWVSPRVRVASVYIDQFPQNDLARGRAERHGLKLSASIEEALTLGTGELAVDGVAIIAEHGNYPRNDKGQKLYPRYRWFKEIVKVFERSGRSVPVFNDKHLSTDWDECREMVADSRRLNFPFFAGSSLPVTRRMPSIDMPYNCPLQESVCVAYGGVDSYDIHALETAQCMSERRLGGEVGISRVQALRGDRMWRFLDRPDREPTRRAMVAAFTRSHNLPVVEGYYTEPISFAWARKTFPNTTAYFIEHRDGFRTSMFLTGIQDFNYAGVRADNQEIISTQMYLPMPTHGSTTADFFHPLVRHIENSVLTGKTPYPAERTLLTSGMVIAGVESLHRGQAVVDTPDMGIQYTVGPQSTFWQA